MNRNHTVSRSLLLAALTLTAGTSLAQTATGSPVANHIQRDVNQQTRIEQGLQSGQLSTKEAAQLERQEAHLDKLQQKDLRDGTINPQEQAQLTAAQNRVSQHIYAEQHNARTGNPDSASSQRMQADVQRNVNQQQRIEAGIQNGSLTNREVGKLERGQSHVNHAEAVAGANGHVGAREQSQLQMRERNQSQHIHYTRHNGHQRRG
jgi:hypothetical protein